MPDADTIVPLLREAGFDEIEVEEMPLRWRFDSSDELWILASELQGPIALAIAKLEEAERAEVRAAIEQCAAEFATGDGHELPGQRSTWSPGSSYGLAAGVRRGR